MKYILILIIAIFIIGSCKKEDEFEWSDEKYIDNFITKDKNRKLIKTKPFEIYVTPIIGLKLDNHSYFSDDHIVKYTPDFDSVVVKTNGKLLMSNFEFAETDSINIEVIDSLPDRADLTIEVFCKWYYNNNADFTDIKVTDGAPVYFTTEKEEIEFTYKNTIPFHVGFKHADASYDYLFDKYITPSFISSYDFEHEYVIGNYHFKYNPVCKIVTSTNEYFVENFFYENGIITMYPEELIASNEECTCYIKAQWLVKFGDSDWKTYNGEIESYKIKIANIDDIYISPLDKTSFITYPLDRQLNFLIDEYDKGYLYPYNEHVKNIIENLDLIVNYTKLSLGINFYIDMNLNNENGAFEYYLPKTILDPQEIYKVSFYSNKLSDTVYTYYFQTSYYRTFLDKWEGEGFLGSKSNIKYNEGFVYYVPTLYFNPVNEGVDDYESFYFISRRHELPLIQFVSEPSSLFNGTKEEAMYEREDIIDMIYRTPGQNREFCLAFGFAPYNAIFFNMDSQISDGFLIHHFLTNNDINTETPYIDLYSFRWQYYVFTQAMYDIRSVINQYPSFEQDKPRFENDILVEGVEVEIPPMEVAYVLPGINVKTTVIEDYQIPE